MTRHKCEREAVEIANLKSSAGSVSIGGDIEYGKRRDFIRRPERLRLRCKVLAKVFQKTTSAEITPLQM